jgi:FAD/FMN-containing dehydrogenase
MSIAGLREAYAGRLIGDAHEMAPFLTDWRRQWTGAALAVVQPATTEEVAQVVGWCARTRTPIVPQGGNTGLSGGATPDPSGHAIVLSLTRLNKVRAVDTLNNTVTAEAGVVLQTLQEAARSAGRLFPLSLAAEGSCTIGGNLATNAGGTGVLRYGNARELCLGLEVVTAGGEIWDGLRGLRKDNTGLDLRDLYIGSEGVLGVITAAVLKLFPEPKGVGVAFIAVETVPDALALLELAQTRLGGALTGFEMISDLCLRLVERHFEGARTPLSARARWYVLAEVSDLISAAGATTAMEGFLEPALETGLAADAVIAASIAQAKALWALRENVSEAQGLEGKGIKHDIAVPISRIAAFVDEASAALEQRFPTARLGAFGHLGDGNLHFNVLPPEGDSGTALVARTADVNDTVHSIVARHGGSISAEHGLGVLRRDEAARYKSPVELALMRSVKAALDPHGLMNPGKGLA